MIHHCIGFGRDRIEQCMPKIQDKSKEQKDAEAEVQGFKNELGPFVVAAETTRMAMVFTDATQPGNPIIFANDSFLSLTGYAREEVLGQSFNFLMVHAADAETLAKIEAEFQGESDQGRQRVLGRSFHQPGSGGGRRYCSIFCFVR
jgi:PAS domain S-box-containing protein